MILQIASISDKVRLIDSINLNQVFGSSDFYLGLVSARGYLQISLTPRPYFTCTAIIHQAMCCKITQCLV